MSVPLPDLATPASDPTRWRILLVEDCADDAELVCLELEQAGIDADYRCVDDERGVLEALRTFAPQLVLSDRNLPGFCGQRALELVRLHVPDARFAFVAGAIEAAEPAMRPGPAADATLLKQELSELPELVRQLLG